MNSHRVIEAFEYYWSLGSDRALEKVASKFKVSLATAKTWSYKNNWKKKIEDRELLFQKKWEEQHLSDMIKFRKDNLDLVKLLIKKGKKLIDNDNLLPGSVTDIKELIKIGLLLAGDITERAENKITIEREIINE